MVVVFASIGVTWVEGLGSSRCLRMRKYDFKKLLFLPKKNFIFFLLKLCSYLCDGFSSKSTLHVLCTRNLISSNTVMSVQIS